MIGIVGVDTMKDIVSESANNRDMLDGLMKEMQTPEFRKRMPDYLFPGQSQTGKWLEPNQRANSDLNRIQAQACGRYMRALKDMNAELDRLLVGRALGSSLPGMPLLLQVNK